MTIPAWTNGCRGRDEIPCVSIGNGRRIATVDLKTFEDKRQTVRKKLAESFAHSQFIEAAAIDES